MSIVDNDDQTLSELEAVESKKQQTELQDLPEKYRQKTLEEVVKMHQEAEKVSELPAEAPKASGSAIVEQRKAQASQNFNALAQALQSLKKNLCSAIR